MFDNTYSIRIGDEIVTRCLKIFISPKFGVPSFSYLVTCRICFVSVYSKTAHYSAREGRDKNASAKVSAQIRDAEYFEHPVDTFNIFSCVFHRFEGRSVELLA
jgi:hypothetical protein